MLDGTVPGSIGKRATGPGELSVEGFLFSAKDSPRIG